MAVCHSAVPGATPGTRIFLGVVVFNSKHSRLLLGKVWVQIPPTPRWLSRKQVNPAGCNPALRPVRYRGQPPFFSGAGSVTAARLACTEEVGCESRTVHHLMRQ